MRGKIDLTDTFIRLFESSSEEQDKRTRVRSHVPLYLRCQAYKANGDQCTRRRRQNSDLCGTHAKGTPHGRVCGSSASVPHQVKIVTSVKEVNGINYHVDTSTNCVYRTEDILAGNKIPRVIGKLICDEGGGKRIA